MGDSHVGLQARMMSQAMRKLAGTLNRTDTICIFTNQLREKIGVMFGNPETTPGRPGAQVLLLGAARHPPDRDAEGRRRGDRQPRPREGGEEQGRAAVQASPSSTSSTAWDLLGGHGARRRARAEGRPEVGLVLQLRGRAPRPGPPERHCVPARASRRHRRDPPAHPGAARRRPGRLRAASAGRRTGRPGEGGQEEGRAAAAGAECRAGRRGRPRSRRRSRRSRGRTTTSAGRALDRRDPRRSRGATTRPRRCVREARAGRCRSDAQTDAVETLDACGLRRRRACSRTTGPPTSRERGYGDEWIRADLETQGVDRERDRAALDPAAGARAERARRRRRSAAGLAAAPDARAEGVLGGDARAAAARAPLQRNPRSRIGELHLTFCLHMTLFRIRI